MKNNIKQAGFTLVELAIVLVIIGLIVGGVLAGSDLIKSATMQKAIKQIGDVEVGANTFRTKYNDLPGDLRNADAVFTGNTGGDTSFKGMGNADSLIEATADGAGAVTASLGVSGESAAFFSQMAQAGYIKEQINPTVDLTDLTAAAAEVNATDSSALFMPLILGKGAKLVVGSDGTKNYIVLTGDATGIAVAGIAPLGGAVTPLQASNIDNKLDDGLADKGNVLSATVAVPVPGTAEASNAADCATLGVYNAGLTTLQCSLAIRTSF